MKRALVVLMLLVMACPGTAERPAAPPLTAAARAQLRLRDRGDVAGMRRHAWALLARVVAVDRGAPRFEHFRTLAQAFSDDGVSGSARPFRQMIAFDTGIPVLQASGAPMLTYVMFNDPAWRHIRAQRLYRRATLDRINVGFAAATPLPDRRISLFPRDSISLKTVWAVVHADRLTRLSVWDGVGEHAGGGAPSLWPREILVDAGSGGAGEPGTRVVPIESLYHVPIRTDELAAVRAIDPSARPGDLLVLLALHVATAEIPDWIWVTWWWHDLPDAGPYAAGRPATLSGPWRNYLMDVAYSMEAPAEPDGAPNIVFNPYLETFPAGHVSNCMACHQGAVWRGGGAPSFLPVTRGPRPPGDPRFAGATRLDFMWSIATEAH